jgi:hypothetical protein
MSGIISRRNLVVGGLAAGAVAVPAALAQFRAKGIELTGGKPVAFGGTRQPGEREQWEALVGQSFRILTEAGYAGATLAAVQRIEFDPARPKTLARQASFYAYFTVGLSLAPEGQQTYTLIRPDRGQVELFLGRGQDRGNQATLHALFN